MEAVRNRGGESVLNRRRSDKVNRIDASEVIRRRSSELLIDGYNLMHVTRFKPRSSEEGELRRCREGMLALLAERLPAKRYRKITIVFDSDAAPRHLPDEFQWAHLNVLFARTENSADDLIAILIGQHAAPKKLVVISSDHRVQVAASRRNATALDSDDWFDAILEDRADRPARRQQTKTPEKITQEQFSPQELEAFRAEMNEPVDSFAEEQAQPTDDEMLENPFPEGYFDDLEDDD